MTAKDADTAKQEGEVKRNKRMDEHNDSDDEQADEQPDSAVFLDAETATELLSEGETTAMLFEEAPDESEDDIKRTPVRVINTAGAHPLYRSSDSDEERSFLRKAAPHVVTSGMVLAISLLVIHLSPKQTLTTSGQWATIPLSWPTVFPLVFIVGLIVFVATILPYLPGHVEGGER